MPSVTAPQGKPLDVARSFDPALTLHHQGRIAEAEALYSVVLAARPDHFDALQMLGVIKLGRGDLPAALRLTGAALQQRPTSPQVLLNHGNVLNAMQRHHEALANFDEAIKRKKSFAEAHCNRGPTLLALGRNEESLESFRCAIALKPDYADAFYNQGNALRLLNRNPDALKSFDRAIALRPNYAKAHCNRGAALEALGKSTEALAEF